MYYSKYGSPKDINVLNFAQISKFGNKNGEKLEICFSLLFFYISELLNSYWEQNFRV